MTTDELNELFEKETAHLRTDSFRKKLRETTSANFPPFLKMKRRLMVDGLAATGIVILFCWLQRMSGLGWITIPACVYTIAFIILEMMAFYRYWHIDSAATVNEMMQKFSRQFTGITNTLKIIDTSFFFFIGLLLIANFVHTFISIPAAGLLLLLKAVTSLSVRVWTDRGERMVMQSEESQPN
jgi:hypothetical protein